MHNISDRGDKFREKKRNESKTRKGGRGTRCSCIKLQYLEFACESSWNDISKWPLLSDSFLDATHLELLRTWQVNSVISWCLQTVALTTVKYQHKANRADVYVAVWGVLSAFQLQTFTWKTLLSFEFSSASVGKIKPNADIKTKCDMTCTQRVPSSPAMQNQYPSSFCSHLYT